MLYEVLRVYSNTSSLYGKTNKVLSDAYVFSNKSETDAGQAHNNGVVLPSCVVCVSFLPERNTIIIQHIGKGKNALVWNNTTSKKI